MKSHVLSSSNDCQEASKGKMPKYQPFWNDACSSLFSLFSCTVKTSNGLETFFPRKRLWQRATEFSLMEHRLRNWGPPSTGFVILGFIEPGVVSLQNKGLNYTLEASSHNVNLLSLGEVKDFFGSGAHHLVVLANRQERLHRKLKKKCQHTVIFYQHHSIHTAKSNL